MSETANAGGEEPRNLDDAADEEPRELPLAGYSALTAAFLAAFSGSMALAVRSKGELPAAPTPWDVATIGVATHKLTRLIAKAKVTSFIRAPFVRYEGTAGRGEVSESVEGTGLRRAAGELLVCPHCLGQWVAGGFGVGLVAAPRLSRLIAAIYTAQATADFLQIAYRAAGEAGESPAAAPAPGSG